MKRILITATALALAITAFIASPAAAVQDTTKCNSWTGTFTQTSYKLCLTVYWRNLPGPHGIAVTDMFGEISGGPWNDNAFECDALRVWNENDTVIWRRDGSPCDMTNNDVHFEFQPNFPDGINMPNTDAASISLAGWPHFAHNADPGRTVLTININDQ